MDTTEKSQQSSTQHGMRLQKSFVSTTPFSPGRRPFFRYRDLGVEGASGGRMRAYQNTSIVGMTEPTGWHYHTCEMQFVYVLKGKLVIEFEDGTVGTFARRRFVLHPRRRAPQRDLRVRGQGGARGVGAGQDRDGQCRAAGGFA